MREEGGSYSRGAPILFKKFVQEATIRERLLNRAASDRANTVNLRSILQTCSTSILFRTYDTILFRTYDTDLQCSS